MVSHSQSCDISTFPPDSWSPFPRGESHPLLPAYPMLCLLRSTQYCQPGLGTYMLGWRRKPIVLANDSLCICHKLTPPSRLHPTPLLSTYSPLPWPSVLPIPLDICATFCQGIMVRVQRQGTALYGSLVLRERRGDPRGAKLE